jgi:hypothetical protein
MKDRIGNVLAAGDKVLVDLGTSNICGFVSGLEEPGLVTVRMGNEAEIKPGRILVACVIALPVDAIQNAVAGVIKVYDPDKKGTQTLLEMTKDRQGPQREN